VVDRLGQCLHLKLQQLLLKVSDHLLPLLNLSVLHPHMVLKVDNLVGMGLHLLMGDVEQHVGVVPSVLSVIKATVNLLYLTVLL
jgi:hypothetical protein